MVQAHQPPWAFKAEGEGQNHSCKDNSYANVSKSTERADIHVNTTKGQSPSFINSSYKNLLIIYYAPGALLAAENMMMRKKTNIALHSRDIRPGKEDGHQPNVPIDHEQQLLRPVRRSKAHSVLRACGEKALT